MSKASNQISREQVRHLLSGIKPEKSIANQIRGRQSRDEGKAFEELIDISCQYYSGHGLAEIEKTPEPMKIIKKLNYNQFIACFEKKAQPDYKGCLKCGKTIVFEAKHTSSDKMNQSRVNEVQADILNKYSNLGAECFILIGYSFLDFYKIPWDIWSDMSVIFGRKYIKKEDVERYRIEFDGQKILFLG